MQSVAAAPALPSASPSYGADTTSSDSDRKRLDREAKFGAAAWTAARTNTRTMQHLYTRARFWIGLLTSVDSRTYARFWANSTVPLLQGRAPRESRVFCPGKLARSGAMDSAGYCDAFWPSRREEACAAYVIGVGGHWAFPRYATSMGCIVHAYDPTLELRRRHQIDAGRMKDVNFHFAGLGGASGRTSGQSTPAQASSYNSYGTIGSAHLMTLGEMVESHGAGFRQMRVLTIDCEGCEWAAMEQLAQNGSSTSVLQHVELLMVEVHVSPSMVAPTLTQFVNLFEFLLLKQGFKLWWLRTNDGYPYDQKVVDFLGMGGLRAGLCCYELAFHRPPRAARREPRRALSKLEEARQRLSPLSTSRQQYKLAMNRQDVGHLASKFGHAAS